MSTPDHAQQDVAFVRQALAHQESRSHGPISIALLWALYVAGGYVLGDFYPRESAWWFQIGMLAVVFAAWYVCFRFEPFAGEINRRAGTRHALHWTVLVFVFWALVPIALQHQELFPLWGSLATLLMAVAFLYAGLHLDPSYLLPGILLLIGSVVVDHLGRYAGTIIGLPAGFALAAGSLWSARKRA